MNDKELLMMAAKAAGISEEARLIAESGFSGSKWNPLTDDGDALRLAVKLDLLVDNEGGISFVCSPDLVDDFEEHHNGDPYAATRRTIVRAAAEIGRKL